MKVLVTGAGGFIGAATVCAMRAAGATVKAGVRRPKSPEEVLCDLDVPETLPNALSNVDLVVHCAVGDISAMPRQTQSLLNAMRAAGVHRLIALSSISVYGEADGCVAETTPALGRLGFYGAAKIDCESRIEAWARCDGTAALLRPGIVYGTGSRLWIDNMAARIRNNALGDFGRFGQGIAALIHVDDLVSMIVYLGDIDVQVKLNLIGPDTPTWNEYFAALAETIGAPPLRLWSEAEIRCRAALALPAKVWRRFGLPGLQELAFSPRNIDLKLFSRVARYKMATAHRLGHIPRVGLAEGLKRTRVG